MNSVGIDISKGRSTVAVMRPFGEVVISPFEVRHTDSELSELARQLKSLDGETRVVMEATGNYHAPVAKLLHDAGLYVSVVNAKLVHGYGNNDLRRVKTDRKDAVKLANYGLDRWLTLPRYIPEEDTRLLLKNCYRQYRQYSKVQTVLKNNLVSLLDTVFPNANRLFSSPICRDGSEKWVDFVAEFWHCRCVGVPAGDGFITANGEVHFGNGDFGAACARLGGDDTAIVVLKVDVIAILKLRIDPDVLGLIDVRDRAEGDFGVPAGEGLARGRGDGRLIERFAVLHDLLAEQSLTGIEFVGAISARIGHNAQDADIAAGRDGLNGGVIDLLDIIIGQYRDGYQRQTHAKSQQKTENSFFHCIHPLFSLCFRGHFLSCGVGPHMANGDKRRRAVTQSGSTSRLWLLSFRGRDAKPPFRCRYDVRCSHVSCGEEPEQTSAVFLRQINYTAIPTENQRLQEKYYGISTKQEEKQP